MGFDAERFRATELVYRTEAVPVPGLAQWFDEGDEPLWTVRSLSFEELARAENSAKNNQLVTELIVSLSSGTNVKDQAEKIKNALGFGDKVPADAILKMQHLAIGSVTPAIDYALSVKLATAHPVEFRILTQKILELTGLGYVPGKPKASGKKTTSKAA